MTLGGVEKGKDVCSLTRRSRERIHWECGGGCAETKVCSGGLSPWPHPVLGKTGAPKARDCRKPPRRWSCHFRSSKNVELMEKR